MNHVIHTPTDSVTEPGRVRLSDPPYYGFPESLLDVLETIGGIGPSSPCGLCGDTILGQRHRVIDAVTERLRVGEWDAHEDYGIPSTELWAVVMASYEHDKALRRKRRAERVA